MLVAACAALALGAVSTWSAFSSSTADAGNYFATQSTFGGCTNNISTPIYLTGVENGRVSNLGGFSWSSMTGAMSVDSTVSRTGSYSMRAAPVNATAYVLKAMVTNVVPYPTTGVARFALRLQSPPTSDAEFFRFQAVTNDGSMQLRYIAATQKLEVILRGALAGGNQTSVQSTTTVSAGTWYVIDLRYAVGSTTHSVDWRIGGTAQPTASVAGPTDTVDAAYFGTGSIASTYIAQYDDIMLTGASTDYPLGAGGVHLLKPNGMGTSVGAVNFQEEDGTAIDANTWTRLDDVPATSTADFIRQSTASGTSYVELTYEDTPHTCIRAVWGRVLWHFAGTNQANNAKASVYDGTRENVIREGSWNSSTDTASRQQTEVVRPLNAPWTQSAVNGLVGRFGYSTDVGPPPMLDAMLLEYEAAE